jgi:hypothetical protein
MQKLSVWKLLWVGGMCFSSCGCSPESADPPSAAESSQVTAQQAVAGVGKKGQSLRDNTGLALAITAGPATLLNLEQKAVLEFQIPPAVQMFKATEGRFPKSHEEFMQKIIEPNRLVLPTLPDGAVYHFNSEKGELWVYPEAEVPH